MMKFDHLDPHNMQLLEVWGPKDGAKEDAEQTGGIELTVLGYADHTNNVVICIPSSGRIHK